MKNLILIAPPAAGKGTLSDILKAEYGYTHIATGQLLRDEVDKGGPMADTIKRIQDEGGLVDDKTVLEILKKRIQEKDCQNGYILDGVPRNIEQAKAYDEIIKDLGIDIGIVIFIDAPLEITMPRIIGRRTCPECKKKYNITFPEMMPKNENTCDECNVELFHRSDDNEEIFKERYNTYMEKTAPLIDYYKEKGILYHIDGSKGSKYTTEQVLPLLEENND